MEQNYCMINSQNVCDNVVVWDGNPNTWTPPEGYTMLVQATTPTKVWELNADKSAWVLVDSVGGGAIGFTWDGVYLITNEPMPTAQPAATNQPTSTGTQTI